MTRKKPLDERVTQEVLRVRHFIDRGEGRHKRLWIAENLARLAGLAAFELRLALILLEDICKDDSQASARALGFLAGYDERTGSDLKQRHSPTREGVLEDAIRDALAFLPYNQWTHCEPKKAARILLAALTEGDAGVVSSTWPPDLTPSASAEDTP